MRSAKAPAAIMGMGAVTPFGRGYRPLWSGLRSGQATASELEHLPAWCPVRFACAVPEFGAAEVLGGKEARRLDPFGRMALVAALDALEEAGETGVDPRRASMVVGTGIGGVSTHECAVENALAHRLSKVSPLTVSMVMPSSAATTISRRLGWRGQSVTISTACSSGTDAVAEGLRLIREGVADVVLAGGAEAPLTPFVIFAFALSGALSTRSEDPSRASRPFDQGRDGFVLGEGAAFVLLESLEHAENRGASPRALVTGYGRTSDAYHVVMPDPDGTGAEECMRQALEDAGIGPADVSVINTHGTSTRQNDQAEALAISRVFGRDRPAFSVKGALGHSLGAAGAVEAVASCLVLEHGEVPPTANTTDIDPALALDLVIGQPRVVDRGAVISNSFGFGGNNSCIVIEPAD